MKKVCFIPFFAVAPLFFAGCGDDVATTTVNETTVVESGISQLAAGEAFPECTEEEFDEMLYAADSGKAYICTGNAWTPLHGESSADTVVIRDTLLQKDSVFFSQNDTVVISKVDTVLLKDTLVIRDTLLQKDSVFFSQIDTVVLSNVDTVFFKDTLVIRDTLLGLNGESCTAEMLEDSTGYKIVCGGDSVGVVLNGINGEKGDDGESCTVADSGNGVVSVQCAADTVKFYKAVCGTTPYDPESSGSICQNGVFYLIDNRDGQRYRVTTIGTQTWMAENLNYDYSEWTAMSYCYDNSADSCAKYGRLYTWSAAIDSVALANDGENPLTCGNGVECGLSGTVRGVCPEGWHLPSYDEWSVLINAMGENSLSGKMLKATSGWADDGNGTDAYGFSALPAGCWGGYVEFYEVGYASYFWSSSMVEEVHLAYSSAHSVALLSRSVFALLDNYGRKDYAFSVRCVRDAD